MQAEVITELDLAAAGVTSVIWAIGYTFDFSWVRLPVLDGDGYPVQQTRGHSFYGPLFPRSPLAAHGNIRPALWRWRGRRPRRRPHRCQPATLVNKEWHLDSR